MSIEIELPDESPIEKVLTPERLKSYSEEEIEELEFFAQFVEALIVVEGKKGSGKTQLAVAILYKLKKYFELPIVSDQKLRPAFGEYNHLDEASFVGEIDRVSDIARGTSQDEIELAVEFSLQKHGIKLANAAIMLDEAYKYFDCRTPSDKLVRVFGYFVAQMRHYHATLILCCPNRRYLDQRVRDQIDFLCKVAYDKYEEVVHARFLSYETGDVIPLAVYGPSYRDLYHSWSPIAMRKKVLDITRSL